MNLAAEGRLDQKMLDQKLTIVIPTMNRQEFILRVLRYYAGTGFHGRLLIGDASVGPQAQSTQHTVERFRSELPVEFCGSSGLNEPETTKRLLDRVTTPYVALLPDDDLHVPGAMGRCVEFLDQHPDYSAAHGRAVMVMLQRPGAYGPLEATWGHYWNEEHGQTAAQRLLSFLGPNYFTAMFSIHRTEQLLAIYHSPHASSVLHDKVFMEALVGCLTIIQGKVKRLDCLHVIRQHHDRRYFPEDFFDWVTGPRWRAAYEGFRECLVEELVRQDRISDEEARELVKRGFWLWLASRLMSRWRKREGLDGQRWRGLREVARRTPGLKEAWRFLRATAGDEGGVSLPALLHPRSPYHRDFMPIYQVLTEAEA